MERQYIGARYVPVFFENPNTGDSSWLSGVAYEALTIVTFANNSYTSKKPVPAGIGAPNLNPQYWVSTGNFNAQIEELRTELTQDIEAVDEKLDTDEKDIFIVSAVLRNDGTGWHALTTGQHSPINVENVSVDNNGDILLEFSKTGSNVISLVVTPDETLAGYLTMGSSVDTDKARISLYSLPEIYGGYVAYDGTSWDISNSNFSAATWNSDNGHLILEVPNNGLVQRTDKDAFLITCNGRECDARLEGGHGIYSEHVVFYSSGTPVMTPNTSLKVFATKLFPSKKLNANNVVSAGGNIWVYGIIEK